MEDKNPSEPPLPYQSLLLTRISSPQSQKGNMEYQYQANANTMTKENTNMNYPLKSFDV